MRSFFITAPQSISLPFDILQEAIVFDFEDALQTSLSLKPYCVIVPDIKSLADIERACVRLSVAEVMADLPDQTTSLIASICPHPGLIADLCRKPILPSRLIALTWQPTALASLLHLADPLVDPDGRYIAPLQTARSDLVFAAHLNGLAPLDACPAGINDARFQLLCTQAQAQGFDGIMRLP